MCYSFVGASFPGVPRVYAFIYPPICLFYPSIYLFLTLYISFSLFLSPHLVSMSFSTRLTRNRVSFFWRGCLLQLFWLKRETHKSTPLRKRLLRAQGDRRGELGPGGGSGGSLNGGRGTTNALSFHLRKSHYMWPCRAAGPSSIEH